MGKVARSAAYEAALADSDARIVGRFSRGNVRLQNGVFVAKMDKIASDGDVAMNRLRKKFGNAFGRPSSSKNPTGG